MPYPWDVEGVLRGSLGYPHNLKLRRLEEALAKRSVDGIALGIRADESPGRLMNLRVRGELYQARGRWIVTPIARWTAEDVIGYILDRDILPLNPIYYKAEVNEDLNRVRDGTWWPRLAADSHGQREWFARHYPEVVSLYDRAVRAALPSRWSVLW